MPDKQPDDLLTAIKNVINSEGPITFARYMELALYHPRWGYYTSAAGQIGPGGDFYTSPDVHPLFGQLLSRQFVQMWELLGRPNPFYLVEWGPGKGLLARDVLTRLKEEEPECFASLNFRAVEIGEPLARRQQKLLMPLAKYNSQFQWLKPRELLKSPGDLTGCVYSNELVDAFSVHLVCAASEGLREIYVGLEEGELVEIMLPPSSQEIINYFSEAGVNLEAGRRAEVNLQSRIWLKQIAASLKRGFLLTIDYGHETRELFSPHRFNGTLRCFSRHQMVDNPYQTPGKMDITASVDFSALIRWGDEFGLQTAGLTSQSDFLLNLGILDTLRAYDNFKFSQEGMRTTSAVKNLIMPEGMGRAFKVLIQYKGLEEKPQLKGLGKNWRL